MTPDRGAIEFGPDPDHPGRFVAVMRWDDLGLRVHETLRAVNESSPLEAVEALVEEWQHMVDRPEQHEFPT